MAKHQFDWKTPDIFDGHFGSPAKSHARRKDPATSKLAAKSIDATLCQADQKRFY